MNQIRSSKAYGLPQKGSLMNTKGLGGRDSWVETRGVRSVANQTPVSCHIEISDILHALTITIIIHSQLASRLQEDGNSFSRFSHVSLIFCCFALQAKPYQSSSPVADRLPQAFSLRLCQTPLHTVSTWTLDRQILLDVLPSTSRVLIE